MKPTLLVLAAGMGSRYGGLKQMDKFGPHGESIIDYSIYDAIRAGFGKVVFIVRQSFLEDIEKLYRNKIGDKIDLEFVTQDVLDIPIGIPIHPEREKPWGTAHAVLVAKDVIDEPFAVINGDDYYGVDAYKVLASFFEECISKNIKDTYAMVAYYLKNTLSDYGNVNRGICHKNGKYLSKIVETLKISKLPDGSGSYELDGAQHNLAPDTLVSMNMFGFMPDYFELTGAQFAAFLKADGMQLKSEFFIPLVLDTLIKGGKKKLEVLESDAKWFGVTYQEDKPHVMDQIQGLIKAGVYPDNLWA